MSRVVERLELALRRPVRLESDTTYQRVDLSLAPDFQRGSHDLVGAIDARGLHNTRILSGSLRGFERYDREWRRNLRHPFAKLAGVYLDGAVGCELRLAIEGFPGPGLWARGMIYCRIDAEIWRCFSGVNFDARPSSDGRQCSHNEVRGVGGDLWGWSPEDDPWIRRAVTCSRYAEGMGSDFLVGTCPYLLVDALTVAGDTMAIAKVTGRAMRFRRLHGQQLWIPGVYAPNLADPTIPHNHRVDGNVYEDSVLCASAAGRGSQYLVHASFANTQNRPTKLRRLTLVRDPDQAEVKAFGITDQVIDPEEVRLIGWASLEEATTLGGRWRGLPLECGAFTPGFRDRIEVRAA